MTAKTIEYIVHVLVATVEGNQEPKGFMMHVYGHKNTKISDITYEVKSQVEKLQAEILN